MSPKPVQPSVFDFEDARAYLASLLQFRRGRNRAYSKRSFARDLGVAPSTICALIDGVQSLSVRSAVRISERLGLCLGERRYFVNLAVLGSGKLGRDDAVDLGNENIRLRQQQAMTTSADPRHETRVDSFARSQIRFVGSSHEIEFVLGRIKSICALHSRPMIANRTELVWLIMIDVFRDSNPWQTQDSENIFKSKRQTRASDVARYNFASTLGPEDLVAE